MKSKKSELADIQYFSEEIRALEPLIEMHRNGQNTIMVKQYEARKLKFFNELLVALIDSSINADEPRALFLVQQLIQLHYPTYTHHLSDQPEARHYAEILTSAFPPAALSIAQEPAAHYKKK